ncbi:hypothetical protein [Brevifollis gellanilyticus]|nr:hypothetical protein [Brevifollis gellanilyticus]
MKRVLLELEQARLEARQISTQATSVESNAAAAATARIKAVYDPNNSNPRYDPGSQAVVSPSVRAKAAAKEARWKKILADVDAQCQRVASVLRQHGIDSLRGLTYMPEMLPIGRPPRTASEQRAQVTNSSALCY